MAPIELIDKSPFAAPNLKGFESPTFSLCLFAHRRCGGLFAVENLPAAGWVAYNGNAAAR